MVFAESGPLPIDGFLDDDDLASHLTKSCGGAVGGVYVIGDSGDEG